jgi:hypothetical protein
VDTPARPAYDNEPAAPESRDARKERLIGQGNKIDQRTEASRGGARNEGLNDRNRGTFEKFVAESGKKNEFLADATEQQTQIFKRIEDTLLQLRGAGTEDSKKLREELDNIANELHDSDETGAKSKVTGILQNARQSAATGTRNETGTLGDAYAALRGKKDVLKEGFSFDSRTGTARNDATGQLAGKDAKMGKFKGAATILGSYIGNKVEESVESKRSPGFQNFLGNFKQTQLPEVTGTGEENKIGTTPTTGGSAIKGATGKMEVQTLNVTAKVVNIADARAKRDAGAKPVAGPRAVPASRAAAPRPMPAPAPASAPAAPPPPPAAAAAPVAAAATAAPTAAAAPAEEGGSILGTAAEMATSGGMLSKAGSVLKAAGPGLLKGGAVALGGAALSYGGDKLKEAGYEKTGAAADIAGQAATWGGTGAMIGSVIPGVGTAIGAGVGAAAGGAYGLYKNWGSLFGGKKEGEAQATSESSMTEKTSKTQVAGEDVGDKLSDKQMSVIGMSKGMGNSYPPEIEAKYQAQLKNSGSPGAGSASAVPASASAPTEAPITFRRSKRTSSTIGGRVINGYENGYSLNGKTEDVAAADEAWDTAMKSKDQAEAEAAGQRFTQLANMINSEEYRARMKAASAAQKAQKVEARAAGGPVVEGKSYLVGEKGPEIMTAESSGKITPNNLAGKDLKEFQKYAQLRGQLESADFLRSSDGKDTYSDVSPEVQARTHLRKKELSKMEESLKAKGIDTEAHYNAPEGAAEAKMGEAGYVSLADKYNSSKKVGKLSAENAAAKEGNSQPIIINQQQAAPAAPAQQTTMVPRGNVRPQESALESYNRRSASY